MIVTAEGPLSTSTQASSNTSALNPPFATDVSAAVLKHTPEISTVVNHASAPEPSPSLSTNADPTPTPKPTSTITDLNPISASDHTQETSPLPTDPHAPETPSESNDVEPMSATEQTSTGASTTKQVAKDRMCMVPGCNVVVKKLWNHMHSKKHSNLSGLFGLGMYLQNIYY